MTPVEQMRELLQYVVTNSVANGDCAPHSISLAGEQVGMNFGDEHAVRRAVSAAHGETKRARKILKTGVWLFHTDLEGFAVAQGFCLLVLCPSTDLQKNSFTPYWCEVINGNVTNNARTIAIEFNGTDHYQPITQSGRTGESHEQLMNRLRQLPSYEDFQTQQSIIDGDPDAKYAAEHAEATKQSIQ